MSELPLAPLKRLFKQAGAERVSDDAMMILADNLEDQTSIIAENAINMAKHAGRKTVQVDDLELAIKTLYD